MVKVSGLVVTPPSTIFQQHSWLSVYQSRYSWNIVEVMLNTNMQMVKLDEDIKWRKKTTQSQHF